ncbi:methyltransferase type 11 [Acidaminococcus sp. CAG:917]|nr:methyltransferase type 11 [Acidaminococcus sp. CAG:917]
MIFKGWDWEKNKDNYWLTPDNDAYFLAERFQDLGYKDIFDLGVGLGRHSIFFARRGFRVKGIDISEYAVKHLKEIAEDNKLNIEVKCANMLSIPFPDNSFDVVFSFNVIYHTDTKGFQTVLGEIKRVLKNGGEFYFTMISKNSVTFKDPAYPKTFVDENTLIIDAKEAEKDVPHFYVNLDDIKNLFTADFDFVSPIKEVETTEILPDGSFKEFSKHFVLHLKKR